MNPAFGPAQIRELTKIFVEKSLELRDVWAEESRKTGGTVRIDVLSWLSRMTLDVIGLAGFNYKFNALSNGPQKNELNQAFDTVFRAGNTFSITPMIRGMVPALRFLPDERDAKIKHATQTMDRIGKQLLRDSKAALLADEGGNGNPEKSSCPGRDLLSLLLRANMSTDLPPNQRMTDEDVLAREYS
jgi:cytochrome P450